MDNSHSEASKLLEAALEQMDGIIQGAKYDIPNYSELQSNGHNSSSSGDARRQTAAMQTAPSPSARRRQICEALKTLRGAILDANEAELTGVVTEADQETARFLAHWLQNNPPHPRSRGQEEEDDSVLFRLEERLVRLESERDAAGLSATMAREQLERQESRMADLEQLLEAKKELLRKTEAALERERQARKALEEENPHYSEIAHLKGRCAELELENQELRKICGGNRTPRYLPLSPNNNGSARARDRDLGSSSVDSSPDEQPRREIYAGQSTAEGESPLQEVDEGNISTTRPARSGFKKIFGKIKRSNSGGPMEEGGKRAETPEFRRGGFRATAGGRLAAGNNSLVERNREASTARTARPVSEWSVDTVCTWLECLGLGVYCSEARKVLGSGAQLAGMGFVDLEHRLGVRHYLHRKKLYLALSARQNAATRPDPEGGLDFHWVLRWLDDVGLPQYKDAFLEARVDGRVLNVMTTDDLFLLKVTSQLHHYSLRRGIQACCLVIVVRLLLLLFLFLLLLSNASYIVNCY